MQETSYSEAVREMRYRRGWSRQRLADELGVTIGTVARWERGETHPAAYSLRRLHDIGASDSIHQSQARLVNQLAELAELCEQLAAKLQCLRKHLAQVQMTQDALSR